MKPLGIAEALRARGGGSYHAMTNFRLSAKTKPAPGTIPAAPDAISTMTDVWVDKLGNFRLVEINDQEGGREITRVGSEAVVAMRYGKSVRRSMTQEEAKAILSEALGGPYAAWEIFSRQAIAEASAEGVFRLRRADKPLPVPKASTPLRSWRDSIVVDTVEGEIRGEGGLITMASVLTAFHALRDNVPLDGEIAVTVTVSDLGQGGPITLPEADPLPSRQRTILEERALLGGLQEMNRYGGNGR